MAGLVQTEQGSACTALRWTQDTVRQKRVRDDAESTMDVISLFSRIALTRDDLDDE